MSRLENRGLLLLVRCLRGDSFCAVRITADGSQAAQVRRPKADPILSSSLNTEWS